MVGLDILLFLNSFDISAESILVVVIEFATVMKINASHLSNAPPSTPKMK